MLGIMRRFFANAQRHRTNMCGIAGIVTLDAAARAVPAEVVGMLEAIAHRGPDAQALVALADGRVVLGHRRLSIVDLSETGAQPMHSASGRYTIVFNGEIYNFGELRTRLARARPAPWRGTSDTEVALEAIEQWGVARALTEFNAMFAFALWDAQARTLTLARDRFGEKPLYYGVVGERLLFGSELKAFFALPGFRAPLDEEAVRAFLEFGYIAAPRSILKTIAKLEPGCFATVAIDAPRAPVVSKPFWRALDEAIAALGDRLPDDDATALAAFEPAFERAVAMRTVADVPVGAFLSGGIDSSAVVCAMVRSGQAVRTFSIGFEEASYDEAQDAARVARALGTEHTEFRVSARDALDVVPALAAMYDEPFGDSSQIPTYLVSKLARARVTVALSGDAGDELFLGYNRHAHLPAAWRKVRRVPSVLRPLVGAALAGRTSRVPIEAIARRIPALARTRLLGEKLQKVARLVAARDARDAYYQVRRLWDGELASAWHRDAFDAAWHAAERAGFDLAEVVALLDTIDYLPGDVLTKVDRASMAVSLEARVPFLDIDLFRLAWRLPLHQRLAGATGKQVVRRYLARYLPPEVLEKPKMGFGLPIQVWLRGALRDWAEDLLEPARLERTPGLPVAPIRAAWEMHARGEADRHHMLWNALTLQAWMGTYARHLC